MRSDTADREATIAFIADASPIGVLVYNAGLAIGGDPSALEPNAVDRMIDVSFRIVHHAGVEAVRKMRTGARVVLIGSQHGDRAVLGGFQHDDQVDAAWHGAGAGA